MKKGIDLLQKHHLLIQSLIKKYLPSVTVWVYGSRVKGTAQPHSDLDMIVFVTEQQKLQVSDLQEAFDDSVLPFRVDLFVWNDVPKEFHKTIELEHIVFQ